MPTAYIVSVLINIMVGTSSGFILYRIKKRDARHEKEEAEAREGRKRAEAEAVAMRLGLCALLRDRLLVNCQKHVKAGYILPRDLEVLSKMYSAYHDLGGNDMMTILYTEVVNLPHTAPDEGGGEE